MTESIPPSANLALFAPVLSVSSLNRLARERLESAFPLCWVAGEISNLTMAASGHAYFSLKDEAAQVRCVMFRNRVQLLGRRLTNGQRVEARVLVTLYEARGDFQLNVETVREAGRGDLHERFMRLKEKLEGEGLFAGENKRPLPTFPRRLGVVTSPQAAALRDVLSTLERRAPHLEIVLYPTLVQGTEAPAQIVAALEAASRRSECDVLVLCRGGGSLEDLWAFNDETVARAIRACRVPIVTGIGHETDFTIADFAADRRAATPTAAAELAAPERAGLQARLSDLRETLARRFERRLNACGQRLDLLARRLIHPGQRLDRRREGLEALRGRLTAALRQTTALGRARLARIGQRLRLACPDTSTRRMRLERFEDRMRNAWRAGHERQSARLARLEASLAHLDPRKVMARGYSVVRDTEGRIVRDGRTLEPNDAITVSFHTGRAEAKITRIHPQAGRE
ncbi:MAG: exodeoxyribonuclease VII large subunit [Candidatus Accumulibacter sp.]|jgi:exodeoxyribonuclease VII large subunit|nr:exodeoxyribonuclease VII large subunit [Accumulibacter sp.]